MILQEKYTRIQVQVENSPIRGSFFRLEENLRFIDLANLDKYTIKQLKTICRQGLIRGGKKADYIRVIEKDEALITKIKTDNRDYRLKELGL